MSGPGGDDGGLAPEAAYWDGRYRRDGKLWGDGPSELARLAVARLGGARLGGDRLGPGGARLRVLDVGCGYGRDSRYLAAQLGADVLGVDPSPAAVAAARDLTEIAAVEFAVSDAAALAAAGGPGFDVVFASNVYHLLPPFSRLAFASAAVSLTRPGGRLFVSTLSPRDPHHFGKGDAVPGEERSWFEHCYLHFCTEKELRADFCALDVVGLDERSYDERHADGQLHHHVSWILEARRPE